MILCFLIYLKTFLIYDDIYHIHCKTITFVVRLSVHLLTNFNPNNVLICIFHFDLFFMRSFTAFFLISDNGVINLILTLVFMHLKHSISCCKYRTFNLIYIKSYKIPQLEILQLSFSSCHIPKFYLFFL